MGAAQGRVLGSVVAVRLRRARVNPPRRFYCHPRLKDHDDFVMLYPGLYALICTGALNHVSISNRHTYYFVCIWPTTQLGLDGHLGS